MLITIKIKFNDLGRNSAPVKKTPVEWTLKNGDAEVLPPNTTLTDDSGDLIIPGVNIESKDKLILHYKLGKFEKDIPFTLTFSVKANQLFALAQNLKITDEAAVILPSEPIDAVPVVKRVAIINEDRDWLVYESLFNRVRNRKSNKKFQMGLYILERKDVCVWFRDDLDVKTLESLTSAFFPDYEPKDHLIFSNHIWEWKKLEEMGEEFTPRTKRRLVASGKQYRVNLDSFVVLPYNRYDNGSSSRALGTKKLNEFSYQLDEALKWNFWKTASRSCVVSVKRIKDKGAAWITVTKPLGTEWTWDYSVGDPERTTDDFKDKDFLLDKPLDTTGWKLSKFTNDGDKIDVSLKTGVIFVGSEQQSGSGKKDFLDENWIVACLRSDYVVAVNKVMEAKGVSIIKDEKLLVLTELLSITEKTPRDESSEMEIIRSEKGKRVVEKVKKVLQVSDGIQVRDLSPLDKSKIYLAPLNIPHIDIDLKEFKDEFACFGDEKWREFWRKHWAISLGRAKALFLLRYGLQHINPNPQNYLIEFEMEGINPKPTGRIIIRDLQDAAIHREVVWALYGNPTELPPQGETNRSKLADVYQPVIEYEFGKIPDKSQETGTIDKTQNFGPPGTQFLWQRFSAFGSAAKLDTVKAHRDAGRWKLFLATMARWGKSHNRAYVRCIEHQLGVNLTKIDWRSIPKPERYLKEELEYENVGKLCILYDSIISPGDNGSPPVITNVVGGNFPGLIKLLAETKAKQENLEEMFGEEYSDKFAGLLEKPCLIANGSNFKNPKAKIGEIDVETIMITKDKAKIYFGVDEAVKTVFERKLLPLIVTNDDGGTLTYQFKSNNETDMGWEETAASKVHDYLKSKDGQRAVRRYKERGWKPVEPKFCIKVLDAEKNPIEEFPLKFKRGSETQWTDITDGNGEVQIYQYLPHECQINFPPEFCLKFLDAEKQPIKEFPLKFKRGDYETQWTETTDDNGEVKIYQYSPDECQINFPDYDDVFVEVSQIEKWKEMIVERRGAFVATIQFADYDMYVEVSQIEKKEIQVKLHGEFAATVQFV